MTLLTRNLHHNTLTTCGADGRRIVMKFLESRIERRDIIERDRLQHRPLQKCGEAKRLLTGPLDTGKSEDLA